MTEINLICAADLHLGRHVGPRNSMQQQSYVILAWERLIDACLTTHPKIDALLLAGDLIDKDGLFIEMRGIFRRGILKLIDHGIQVIAIAGNHDSKVLDQFKRAIGRPEFCLLGTDGKWERKSFNFKDKTLHIDGISFTESFMRDNPLSSRKWEPAPQGEHLIGLLHCDVDGVESKYAPVRSTDFRGLPHNAWILGHIHIPREINQERPLVRYCGSLQGLDIGECGPRGAWRLTIDSYGTVTSNPLLLAPLRWEQVSVDLSEVSPQDWEDQVLKKIEEKLIAKIGESESIEKIGVRLRFEGRTTIFRELRRNSSRFQEGEEGLTLESRWIPYFVESIINNTRPEFDLKSLSQGSDIVAALARKLLQIQELLSFSEVEYLESKLKRDSYLKQCDKAWPDATECRDLYLSQGYQWLDELLEQKQRSL